MFISDFAIKRPLLTVVAMLTLVGFGLVALLQLQTDEFPEIAPPVVLTTVVYPGHMYSPAPHATMSELQAKNYVYRLRSKDQWMIMFGGA